MAQISILLGIVIGLFASAVQSLGLTIQRKSHVLNQQLPESQQRAELRRPLWLLGFAVFLSSNIFGSVVQIASLPVVILAPLGAVSLLFNALFARVLLGDVFSPWMMLGTIFIAGGAVLIAFFGIVPEPTHSLEDLLRLFSRPAFIAYFSLLGFAVIVCLIVTHAAEFSLSRRMRKLYGSFNLTPPRSPHDTVVNIPSDPTPLITGVTETLAEGTATERTPLLDRKPPPSIISSIHSSVPISRSVQQSRILLAISYASYSGIISGMCLLFAKSGVELLVLTIKGDNQFWRWQAWMLVLGLVAFALLQLWYMHKALTLANPTLVCPSAFCFYNLSSIVNGLVYFDQFSLIPPLHLCLVVLGIIILLAGVWAVSIHSGVDGVDTVSWNPEEDLGTPDSASSDIEVGVVTSPRSEAFERLPPLERIPEDIHGNNLSPPSPIGWGSMSEPNMATRYQDDTPLSPISTASHPLPSLESEVPSRQGSSHRRRPSHPMDASIYSIFRRAPPINTNISPEMPSSSSTTMALANAGFQIGLSPLSPGFSIAFRERRRRVSSNLVPDDGTNIRSNDIERR